MQEISPAVERAEQLASKLAAGAQPTLAHWLLALLDDEDGKPAILLARLGVERTWLLKQFNSPDSVVPVAPQTDGLYHSARQLSVSLRNDPLLTTDYLLLAVLTADLHFGTRMLELGVSPEAVADLLRVKDANVSAPALSSTEAVALAEPREHTDVARVLDANLNRSREALRVLDDTCRFVLNDAVLTEVFKTIRHELVEAAKLLPALLLLSSRETAADVGTGIAVGTEYQRAASANVAEVNLKRLQESLRSLEEFGKVLNTEFARRIEALRYRCYTVEPTLLRSFHSRGQLADATLYLLLCGSQCTASLDWTIGEAAAGGVDIVQLREKNLSDRELLDRAKNVRRWTQQAGVLFIVNDRPDIAAAVGADGVHLGQDDLPLQVARRIVGPDRLIGISTHTLEQVRQAVLDGADCIGIGPTFPSVTKSFDHFPGLDFIRQVSRFTSLPAFALGGINGGNIAGVVAAGANRVAVSSVIATADDPRAMAAELKRSLMPR